MRNLDTRPSRRVLNVMPVGSGLGLRPVLLQNIPYGNTSQLERDVGDERRDPRSDHPFGMGRLRGLPERESSRAASAETGRRGQGRRRSRRSASLALTPPGLPALTIDITQRLRRWA